MIIDDEAYCRRFIGGVLRQARVATILEARHGQEGLELFGPHAPDLVLLDINMPQLDGLQTLTALRRISATVPIVMLTSVADEKMVEECVSQGATYFIRKDLPAHELVAAVRGVLDEFLHQTDASE